MALTILFITHDLAVVGHICDRVAVMYLGRIVEIAPTRTLFQSPRHPYTEALFSRRSDRRPDAAPRAASSCRVTCRAPWHRPSGCVFRTRCPYAVPACAKAVPPLRMVGPGHLAACIREELALRPATA